MPILNFKKKLVSLSFISLILLLWYHNNKPSFNASINTSFVTNVENVASPIFPNNICDITNYGAIPTNKEKNTEAFFSAIQDCHEKGGGTVEVPEGIWLTGKIHLRSNINLHITKNATISFSDNPDDYLPNVKTRFIGLDLYNYSPMIYANNCTNIAITGNGTIDGNGANDGWKYFIKNQKKAIKKLYKMSLSDIPIAERIFGTKDYSLRPSLVQFYNCNIILMKGLTIKEGPMWTIHPVYSDNITIDNLLIKTTSPNTDGIVIDSSTNVLITNNTLSTGDDAIVLKSGRDKDGWQMKKETKNIVIKNNTILEAHGGISFGSEMSGNIQNVFVDKLSVLEADRGIRFKTTTGRGGFIKNILIQNSSIHTSRPKAAVEINMNYGSRTLRPKTKRLPSIKDIRFDNLKISSDFKNPIKLTGLKKQISGIEFRNITLEKEDAIIQLKRVAYIRFINIKSVSYAIKDSNNICITGKNHPSIQTERSKKILTTCD